MANAECPFCGVQFEPRNPNAATHPNTDCTLRLYTTTIDLWNMRPPKKEQPSVTSEVDYLRGLLEKLILREPAKPLYTGIRGGDLLKPIGPGVVK